jgi:hypothetical protein
MHDCRGLKAGDQPKDSEVIGRRIVAPVDLVGAVDQRPKQSPFSLNDFQETRSLQVSLDWLGGSGSPDKRAFVPLGVLAAAQTARRSQPHKFLGWAQIQAGRLTKYKDWPCKVVSDPIEPGHPEHPDFNPYHLVLDMGFENPEKPNRRASHQIALHLQFMFNKHAKLFSHPHEPQLTQWRRALGAALRWIGIGKENPSEDAGGARK